MRVPAALGRLFAEDEAKPGALVAIITDDAWRRRFGADPSIVGQAVRMDGDPSRLSECCHPVSGRSTSTSGFLIVQNS